MVGSMMFIAWIFSFMLSFLCGKLSEAELAAWTTVNINTPLGYTLAIAMADVTLTYMGNSMGEKQIEKAKRFLKASIIITGVGTAMVMAIYAIFSNQISEFYLTDPVAIEYSDKLFKLFLAIWPADCLQMVLGAGLRAIGKEKAGFLTNLCMLYFVSAPLAYYLTFTFGMKVYGLIVGTIVGDYLIFFTYLFIYARLDWTVQNKKVMTKLKHDQLECQSAEISAPTEEITEQLI
jgi:MATE family multidrug resistance protein